MGLVPPPLLLPDSRRAGEELGKEMLVGCALLAPQPPSLGQTFK